MTQDIEITVFGQLTDITGSGKITLPNVPDSETLITALMASYPGLRDKKFVIAVDEVIIRGNHPLQPASRIALLPPFSGG